MRIRASAILRFGCLCKEVSQYSSKVWKPTSPEGDKKSSVAEILFHCLDSFVLEWVASGAQHDDDVIFGDLEVFFRKCPILAFKRTHSTSGKGAAERSAASRHNAKGKC